MSFGEASAISGVDASAWAQKLRRYQTPNAWRAVCELAITAAPFALTWGAMCWSLSLGHVWLYAMLLPLAAGFLVRLFLIQHDCGHQAFFANRHANDWLGRLIGVLTLTPYDHWRRAHAIHHATSGNLGRRGVGDIDTLTVSEYLARSRWTRLRYRVYRHPFVLFGIGPAFLFFLQNRVPAGFMRDGWRPWASTMTTNAALILVATLLMRTVGVGTFLLVSVPILILAATVGGWLFYVQHQFADTYWEKAENWSAREASLFGSSHYDLPLLLRWFTANIGVHHVHHLSSRIPFYRLQRVLNDHPDLQSVGRLTLLHSLKCIRLVLWDERSRRLISFHELRMRIIADNAESLVRSTSLDATAPHQRDVPDSTLTST